MVKIKFFYLASAFQTKAHKEEFFETIKQNKQEVQVCMLYNINRYGKRNRQLEFWYILERLSTLWDWK